MRALVLLLINIFCLAKFVKSYGVVEHRVDHYKSTNGHEYDYHYRDRAAPRFDKNKLNYPHHHQQQQQQQQLLQQSLLTKEKRPFKFPYGNKYFATGFEQILTHPKYPAAIAPTYSSTSFKQQNSIPVYESHEKIIRSFTNADESDYDEILDKRRSGINSLTKNTLYSTTNYHRVPQPHRYNSYDALSESESESEEAPIAPTKSSFASHSPLPGGLKFPASFHYIPSGYTYFNTHTIPQSEHHSQALYVDPSETPTTTRRPYIAPSLTSTTSSPKFNLPRRPTKPSLLRRPYLAPALTTTKRPYVAPQVTRTTPAVPVPERSTKRPTTDRSQNSIYNGASRFRYTTSRTTTSTSAKTKPSDLYEPEFDIDIRIDLSPDSP
ncbi:uncharacterized protein LOC131431110 [Malaya genurostris]|uniref:uncharacterized protein LOC131431110 n=1 Tax=Malaya genurostris TaxID=325434 RepID=UPI0026F3C948|nr:uncharacterized protein LOC131431110 [Malaya genurostris]